MQGMNVFRKILEARSTVKMCTFEKSDTLSHLLNTHCPTATPIQSTTYDK